jgi:hypothetical protein
MYSTLRELIAAYQSGELSRDCPVILDNDQVSVWSDSADAVIYDSYPAKLIEDALDILGVPWECA